MTVRNKLRNKNGTTGNEQNRHACCSAVLIGHTVSKSALLSVRGGTGTPSGPRSEVIEFVYRCLLHAAGAVVV